MMVMDRIGNTFKGIRSGGRPGLVLFLTAGIPDRAATMELVPALVEAGADAIELGVPFSDPLAEGVTIQESSHRALQNGVTLRDCLDMVSNLRGRVPETPLLLMGYFNPVYKYGIERFGEDAREAGLDGMIVADLPEEESGPLRDQLRPRGIHLIPLFAPTSTEARLKEGCRNASGFVYCVSLIGVTGTRENLAETVFPLVSRVRQHTSLPLAVGFGVSNSQHVEAIGEYADAAVVGSALVRVLMDSPRDQVIEKAGQFVTDLKGPQPEKVQMETR